MTVPLFTLTGNISSLTGGSQIPPAGMSLILKSNVRAGDLLAINGVSEFVGTVNVMLDSSGKINGSSGQKLLANDVSLGLSTPVQWTVSSTWVTGFPELTPFTFDAPNADQTLDLVDALPVPGMTAVGQTTGPIVVNNTDGTVSVGSANVLEPMSATVIYSDNTSPPIGKTSYYNASGGNRTPTLPALSGLRVGARLTVRRDPADTSANTVTLSCAASDTFYSAGVASTTLPMSGEQREYQVISVSGTKYWAPAGSLNPVSALDKRYRHQWPFPMARNTIAAVGDSMTARNCFGQPATYQPYINPTYFHLLPIMTHQRIRECGGMYAISNSLISSQESTQLPNVLAMDPLPGACVLCCGAAQIVDDTSFSFSTNQGLIKSMVAQLLAVGVVPILWTIPPINSTGFVSVATINTELNEWNVWVRRYAAQNGFPLIDAHTALAAVDGTHILGPDGVSTTADLLHPNGPGHVLIAQQALADGLADFFPPNSLVNTARTTDDLTNLFNDGTLNLGLFTTNSSGVGTGLTTTGTATFSVTASENTDELLGNWQQMTVAAGNTASVQAPLTSGWSIGDILALSCRVQTENMAVSNAEYSVALITNLSQPYNGIAVWGGFSTLAPDIADGELYLEFPIPSGTTTLAFCSEIQSVASGIATLRVGEVTIRNLTTGGFLA